MFNKKAQVEDSNDLDEEVIDYVKKLRFRKAVLGANEEDLWKVISNIQKHYAQKESEAEVLWKTEIEVLKKQIDERDQKISALMLALQKYRTAYDKLKGEINGK